MWYVIQVKTGEEQKILIQTEKLLCQSDDGNNSKVLEKAFIPRYERKRRYKGQWNTSKEVLFPGYVFLCSEDPEQLYIELKQVVGLTKLLRSDESILPLQEKEEKFLRQVENEENVVELSTGLIEDSQVVIKEGPLKGLESKIKKIDRHKRLAWIEMEMLGEVRLVAVGLEIVEKR